MLYGDKEKDQYLQKKNRLTLCNGLIATEPMSFQGNAGPLASLVVDRKIDAKLKVVAIGERSRAM